MLSNEADSMVSHRQRTAMNEAGDKLADANDKAGCSEADIRCIKGNLLRAAIGENEPTEAQVEEIKGWKRKINGILHRSLFSKMYEAGSRLQEQQGAGPDMGDRFKTGR